MHENSFMENIIDYEEFLKRLREDYIQEQEDKNKYRYNTDFDSFLKDNGVNDDTVTEDMMDWYAYHVCDKKGCFNPYWFVGNCNMNDYINEMLEKTTLDVLKKQLNINLGAGRKYHVSNYTDNDSMANILFVSKEIYDRNEIINTCNKMMWSFSAVEYEEGKWKNPKFVDEPYVFNGYGFPLIRIQVEPIKTKNITDFVNTNCGGKIYHLCEKKHLQYILKSGLRLKGENNVYRHIDNKIYFFCGETDKDIRHCFQILLKSKDLLNYGISWISSNYTVLEIDVNGYNIDFYQDGYYMDDVKYIGYTYNYFPPKRLKEINIKDFLGNEEY